MTDSDRQRFAGTCVLAALFVALPWMRIAVKRVSRRYARLLLAAFRSLFYAPLRRRLKCLNGDFDVSSIGGHQNRRF
jgi:hypothetical protein